MNMVGNASNVIAFAVGIARHGCEIGMQIMPHGENEYGFAVLRAEDDVDDDE